MRDVSTKLSQFVSKRKFHVMACTCPNIPIWEFFFSNSRLSFQWCTQTSSHQLFAILHIYWDLWCYNLWFVHWKIVGVKERLCKFVFLIKKTNRYTMFSTCFMFILSQLKKHPGTHNVIQWCLPPNLSTWVKYPGPTR